MRGLMLTNREQRRIEVLNGVMESKMAVASGLMGESERRAW